MPHEICCSSTRNIKGLSGSILNSFILRTISAIKGLKLECWWMSPKMPSNSFPFGTTITQPAENSAEKEMKEVHQYGHHTKTNRGPLMEERSVKIYKCAHSVVGWSLCDVRYLWFKPANIQKQIQKNPANSGSLGNIFSISRKRNVIRSWSGPGTKSFSRAWVLGLSL